jgi:ELWxxDGT repeat protein
MKPSFSHNWSKMIRCTKSTGRAPRARARRLRLGVELLEDRITLSLVPQMVVDINPAARSGNPTGIAAMGSTAFFAADDGVHGVELWKSDGTAAGTAMVKDINPGSASSSPTNLTSANGTLFFTADDGVNGQELWKSDGTAAGTTLVKDIYPGSGWHGYGYFGGSYYGPNSSAPTQLTAMNGTLFFSAFSATSGWALWRSDGTEVGTTNLSSILDPAQLTNVNGTLFFTGDDRIHGRELWTSDGTAAGTTIVKDIRPSSLPSYPRNLAAVNGTLFFVAMDGNSEGLWRSDGTDAGTFLVKSCGVSTTTSFNGLMYFVRTDSSHGGELWKSDGTAAGTTLVKDLEGGTPSEYPHYLTNVNGTLFLVANNGGGVGDSELWKSDGTAAGTALVEDIRPGSYGSSPNHLTNVNGTLFFLADDGMNGEEVWQSDGTVAGTGLVGDIKPGALSSFPGFLTNVNGTLFFSADDGVHGYELWKVVAGPTQSTTLNVSGFPATITAGVTGTFTVTAKNADGSTNTRYGGTVKFTSSDPQAVLSGNYTFTAADRGVHTFSATLKTAGSRSITATDTLIPGGAGTQAGVAVNPAVASRFTVAGFPSPVSAGSAGSFTVTASDAYGNRVTGYTGTVRFTSSDAKAVLPGNYTFTGADSGTRTFSAMLKTAGIQSLSATDTLNVTFSGAQSVTVKPAAASQIVLNSPATVNAGAKFDMTVTVVDVYGNVATGYRGKLPFRSSDSMAKVPNSYTFTSAELGVHNFTGLVLKKKGKQSITVTDALYSSLTATVSIDVR